MKRISLLSILLILALLFACCPSLADQPEKIYAIDNVVKVYEEASTSSKVIHKMSFGESTTCIAVSGKWAKLKNGAGTIGYCKRTSISEENPNIYKMTYFAQIDGLKVYEFPETSSTVLASVNTDDALICVAKTSDGCWLRVKNGKTYGYVLKKYMDDERYAKGTTVWCSEYAIAVNTEAYEQGASIGNIYFGQSVSKIGQSGNWVKIRNTAGAVGWCHETAITSKNPNKLKIKAYAQTGGKLLLNHLGSRSTAYKAVLNAEMTCVALTEDKLWARVKYGGKYYMISTLYLDTDQLSDCYFSARTTEDGVTMYESAKSTSEVLAKLDEGAKLKVIGGNAKYAYVQYNNTKGYIMVQYLESC